MAHLSADHFVLCWSFVLSRCHIFRQHSAKMARPIFRQIILCCVSYLCCQDATSFVISLPRWPIFRQIILCCVSHLCCQDATSFVSSLPRWPRPSFGRSVCVVLVIYAVKMPHLSSNLCQDGPSFGRSFCVVLVICAVKMPHLSSALCQDGPFFRQIILFCVSHLCFQDATSFVSSLPRSFCVVLVIWADHCFYIYSSYSLSISNIVKLSLNNIFF